MSLLGQSASRLPKLPAHGHVQHELGIARYAFELAQMTDQPGVLHQPLDVFAAHQHHLFRIETEEGLLEGRPLASTRLCLSPARRCAG